MSAQEAGGPPEAGARRLPFTVIGGFLGAGKTTLLNHWLRQPAAPRLALLVNDFGDLQIDATMLASRDGATIALSNGCVCCQIGDDLSAALVRITRDAARYDAVVVEASGVSDPGRIAQYGRADPALVPAGVVVVVDAGAIRAQACDPLLRDTIERQLRAAGVLVVNRADALDAVGREALRGWLAGEAGTAPQVDTADGTLPLALLTGAVDTPAPQGAQDDPAPAHGARFTRWSARPSAEFELEALRDWLRAPPAGVLRLKGWVRARRHGEPPGWHQVQIAGRHGTVARVAPPASGAALVAIGLRGELPEAALDAQFRDPQPLRASLASAGESARPSGPAGPHVHQESSCASGVS